jgi:hypothetical protein
LAGKTVVGAVAPPVQGWAEMPDDALRLGRSQHQPVIGSQFVHQLRPLLEGVPQVGVVAAGALGRDEQPGAVGQVQSRSSVA